MQAPRWRHPAVALLLPVLLIALGAWQLSRVNGAADDFAARADRLQASIERIRPLATREPDAIVRFNGNPRSYTAADALRLMQDDETSLARDVIIERARQGAGWIAVAGGAVSLLAVLGCLLATALCARRGRQSRTALVGSFRTIVRLLPPLLGGVAVPMALAVSAAVLFEAGGAWFLDSISTGEVKLLLCGLAVVVCTLLFAVSTVRRLFGALAAFKPQPMVVLGREAGPDVAPGLWAFLRQTAAGQGAPTPDHVVLGMTGGFFVTSSSIRLLPEDRVLSGSSLYVPAPYLPLLSRGETTAIIAHELAHFTGEDTVYSQHFLPLYAGMARSMDAVTTAQGTANWAEAVFQPAALLAHHVMRTFDHIVAHWSRLREFEADRASLLATTNHAAATALIRTGIGAGLIGGAMDDVFERPAAASPDLVATVLARAGAAGFTDPARHLEDRQPHPTDSHPPTRQRIEALGVSVDEALLAAASRPLHPDDAAFTESLFTDWPALRGELGADLLAAAHAQDRKLQARLEEAAAAVTTNVELHERGGAVVLTVMGGLCVAAALGCLVLVFGSFALNSSDWVLAITGTATFAGIGALFLVLGWSRSRRLRAGPFLVVGPGGFRCIGLAEAVPWSSIDGIEVITGNVHITRFYFTDSAPLPVRTGYRLAIKVDRRKRTLVLKGFVAQEMKPQAYLDLLNRALRAYRAGVLLREREGAAAKVQA